MVSGWLGRFKTELVAIAAFLEALVALALAFEWLTVSQAAAATGTLAAFLVLVRGTVTPVAKVARVIEKPIEVANDLLRKVRP